jgi:DNA-binding phage protein
MAARLPFSEQLRRAIERSELTRYRISQKTGINQSVLSRFMNQGGGLSLDSIDKLCECLGLRLVSDDKPNKKGR